MLYPSLAWPGLAYRVLRCNCFTPRTWSWRNFWGFLFSLDSLGVSGCSRAGWRQSGPQVLTSRNPSSELGLIFPGRAVTLEAVLHVVTEPPDSLPT